VDPPAASGSCRSEAASAVLAPHTVERTVPFQLACQAIAILWYATAGHDPADVEDRRRSAPWYASKAEPSTADMTAKLRRVIIAAGFKAPRPDQPTPQKSVSCGWPGKASPHKHESRVLQLPSERRFDITLEVCQARIVGSVYRDKGERIVGPRLYRDDGTVMGWSHIQASFGSALNIPQAGG
jgi:hypothetical protein